MRLFRYSGNKTRYAHLYRSPPAGATRLVEPYLGAGAYYLQHNFPGLGIDLNERIIALWSYLQTTTPQRLQELQTLVDSLPAKTDIRTIDNITHGEMLYLKVNICSVVVGQFSSWRMYNHKFKLPIDQTIALLPKLRHIQLVHGPASSYQPQPGDTVFLDPPYLNTSSHYKTSSHNLDKEYRPQDTLELIRRIPNPIIFTYGSSAPQDFPDFRWELVAERKVPNMRSGGVVTRQEYVSYHNF